MRMKAKRALESSELRKQKDGRKSPEIFQRVNLFSGIAIWFMYESHRLCDLSQAYALLGIVASLAPVIFGYYSKSRAENTEGGIVYETAMKEQEAIINSESGKG